MLSEQKIKVKKIIDNYHKNMEKKYDVSKPVNRNKEETKINMQEKKI